MSGIEFFTIICAITLLLSAFSLGHYLGTKGFPNILNKPITFRFALNIILAISVILFIIALLS